MVRCRLMFQPKLMTELCPSLQLSTSCFGLATGLTTVPGRQRGISTVPKMLIW